MRAWFEISIIVLIIGSLAGILSGCTLVLQSGRSSDIEKIEALSGKIKQLKLTEEELAKLKQAYVALEKGLSQEISEKKVTLGIEDKGLVITFVDSVLFDAGKAELRSGASKTLDKVIRVCRSNVPNREIGIEGHTDNQPIKYSGWKSNWELSTARATSVLHYLQSKRISPERLSATGFGEYRPVASNKTDGGRQKNRRVEIVILPEKMSRASQLPVIPTKVAPKSKYVK